MPGLTLKDLKPKERLPQKIQFKSASNVSGLANLGNTCFMNAVLQCLTHTGPLSDILLSKQHSSKCSNNGFCAFCALERHVIKAKVSDQVVYPKELFSNLKRIGKTLRMGRQEDSHEFLRLLMDKISGKKSVIDSIFTGSLESQIKCLNCSTTFCKVDPMSDISLDVTPSLLQSLKRFSAVETLSDRYKCEKCKKPCQAQKRMVLKQLPKVLTVHLKRFSPWGSKLNQPLAFPAKLELGESFDLYAVLVHSGGSCHSGHYYAFAKSGEQWYRLDDSYVEPVSLQTVLQQKAYILFYEKKSSSKENQRPQSTQRLVDKQSTLKSSQRPLERQSTKPVEKKGGEKMESKKHLDWLQTLDATLKPSKQTSASPLKQMVQQKTPIKSQATEQKKSQEKTPSQMVEKKEPIENLKRKHARYHSTDQWVVTTVESAPSIKISSASIIDSWEGSEKVKYQQEQILASSKRARYTPSKYDLEYDAPKKRKNKK